MFSEGQVLYISPFYFKNSSTSKNKYFIVLKSINEQVIVASLPTRSAKAPSLITKAHGCINDNERMFNCYASAHNKVITDTGFAFPLPTFIYGNEVEDYDLQILKAICKIEGVDYEQKGKLLETEHHAIIECLKLSTSIRRGIKKLL